MSMHILVVDDDRAVRESLARSLQYSGYEVDSVADGVEALAHLSGSHPDAVIMDVMMPRLDGLEATRMLRSNGNDVPILILTARDAVDDRVDGLDAGADDYMVKPFQFPELLARIRTLLRRGEAVALPSNLRVADLELDPGRHRAYRSGQRIDLTSKEFALLHLLMRRTGEVLTRTEITALVWDINFDCDTNVVDVAIRRLRMKVDEPFGDRLIHTIRGVGYVLEARP